MTRFLFVRDTALSAIASLLVSAVLVGAAVVPAQAALAATLSL